MASNLRKGNVKDSTGRVISVGLVFHCLNRTLVICSVLRALLYLRHAFSSVPNARPAVVIPRRRTARLFPSLISPNVLFRLILIHFEILQLRSIRYPISLPLLGRGSQSLVSVNLRTPAW